MGVTVHYRGTLADLNRVEDFEDRVIDLALAIGGDCRIWRTADQQDPSRVVRGLILDLAPGQETTSLLISPEGWLVGLTEIEAAERGELTEKPWCSVKTQFGPVEGHVALVELLAALKKEFMPDLEVTDEGGYWERRDLAELRHKVEFINRAIGMLEEALSNDGLSPEAAEDPEILAARIERLARIVQQTLTLPAEHPPVQFPDDESGVPPDPVENEALWDEMYKENRRKQERMERMMEEQLLLGADAREALELAIEEATLQIEEEGDDEAGAAEFGFLTDATSDADNDDREDEEPWRQTAEEYESAESNEPTNAASADDSGSMTSLADRFSHPLHRRAQDVWMRLHDVGKRTEERSANIELAMRSAGEIVGGFAQALPLPPSYERASTDMGLNLIQLKRALRGAAFVAGSLFLLREEETIDVSEFRTLHDEAEVIQREIIGLLREIREAQV